MHFNQLWVSELSITYSTENTKQKQRNKIQTWSMLLMRSERDTLILSQDGLNSWVYNHWWSYWKIWNIVIICALTELILVFILGLQFHLGCYKIPKVSRAFTFVFFFSRWYILHCYLYLKPCVLKPSNSRKCSEQEHGTNESKILCNWLCTICPEDPTVQ